MSNLVKIVVFVPQTHTEIIVKAMGDVGAGVIGNYTHCVSISKSLGMYIPQAGANPYIGKVGQLEKVEEDRVETVCERGKVKKVIEAIRKVHPYDEVAFDIYPLIREKDL